MLVTPLMSVAIPDSVLSNRWMKGIFGQMLANLPGEMANRWHAKAAQAAQSKDLSLIPAVFTVSVLRSITSVKLPKKVYDDSLQNRRGTLAELLILLPNPRAKLEALERIQRTCKAMALHARPSPADRTLVLAWGAAVDDVIEMQRMNTSSSTHPHRFGMTLPHALDAIAWRQIYRQFPRPAVGYAEDRAIELEREAACVGFGELLTEQLQDAPEIIAGDASEVR